MVNKVSHTYKHPYRKSNKDKLRGGKKAMANKYMKNSSFL